MNTELARFNMVEQQIRPWNVLDHAVLEQLSFVDRNLFVPSNFVELAYSDTEIPLLHGETMLAPRVAARLAQDLLLKPTDRVLEIGTGSGYLTALLASLSATVLSLECHADLLAQAHTHLQQAGIANAQLLQSSGVPTDLPQASFDAIVLTGSVAQVPTELFDLLKAGGRLMAVVGEEPIMQATRFTRASHGDIHTQVMWDVVLPRLHGFAQAPAFQF
jgi:protein-L-isoaspartate(D-aspartate) O-methyltransferase